jgi:hypothetical protein
LKHPEFLHQVKNIWERSYQAEIAFDRIQEKLKRCKQYFKGWGFNLHGETKRNKERLRQELSDLEQKEEEGLLHLNQMQRKIQILTSLLTMMEEEELYWYRRSHENWLHKGDNNTKYFHRIANGRKRKNTILSFSSDNGAVEGNENLLRHATDYYKTLFGPGEGNTIPLDPNLWGDNEKVTIEDN